MSKLCRWNAPQLKLFYYFFLCWIAASTLSYCPRTPIKREKKGCIIVAHIYSNCMQSARVQGSLLSAMSPKMILRTMFPSNTLIVNVYLNWEMKFLGLDERTDYARDIFGPSWLKFDELRYEHAQKCGTNTKIMSKPFEITEHKCKPGNNPSLMHHDTHAKSLHSAFSYYFLGKALWIFILLQKLLREAWCSDHTPITCWDNSERTALEITRLWSLLTDSAADTSLNQIHMCAHVTWISGVSAKEKTRSWNPAYCPEILNSIQHSHVQCQGWSLL